MDFRLSGKDHIAVLGETVDLVLSRKDLHRSDEADLRLDGVHQHLAVRYASCEKDSVDLAVSGRDIAAMYLQMFKTYALRKV